MTAAPAARAAGQVPADLLYGRLLATAAQRLGGEPSAPARVRSLDGTLEPLPLDRWLGGLDAADRAAVAVSAPPVLDLGPWSASGSRGRA